jgi:sugar/nucleoside kinase (ribokinase family)
MSEPAGPPLDVLAVGNAIVDVLAATPEDLLASQGLVKGTMALVDHDRAERLYAAMGPGMESSGGSAANTAAGVASLGGSAGFVGKVAADELGQVFTHDIRAAGVEFVTPPSPVEPTARCLVMVTPDAERTMSTHLGVAGDIKPSDVDPGQVARGAVLYVEGYLCGLPSSREALARAIELARSSDTTIALSLSDPAWVNLHRDELNRLVDDVHLLFCNEAEAIGLSGAPGLEEALTQLRQRCDVVVVTRGAAGSVVMSAAEQHVVEAAPVERLVDTTGAGDLFAAGFLFGFTHGFGLDHCARLASLAAAEVISHLGARPLAPLSKLAAEAGLL